MEVTMYELTKIIGPVDFTGLDITDALRDDFILRGHITLGDKGDTYAVADIVGAPIALIEEVDEADASIRLLLYAKLFDGPHEDASKAHQLSDILKQGSQHFEYKVILGKTADGEKPKLRVALVQSHDDNAVKLSPTLDLDTLTKLGAVIVSQS
jgi:hypothetical protein